MNISDGGVVERDGSGGFADLKGGVFHLCGLMIRRRHIWTMLVTTSQSNICGGSAEQSCVDSFWSFDDGGQGILGRSGTREAMTIAGVMDNDRHRRIESEVGFQLFGEILLCDGIGSNGGSLGDIHG